LIGIPLTVIAGIFAVVFYAMVARASISTLYTSSCLGGWENTHLAAGSPEATVSGGAPIFNDTNSARLVGNAHAQIYCGGFNGDIIKDTIPKKILVKFSWAVEYPMIPPLETLPLKKTKATSTSNVVNEQGEAIPIEALSPSEPEITEPENTNTEPTPTEPASSESVEPTLESVPESISDTPPAPEASPSPEEPTASIFNLFAMVALAQEIPVEEFSASTSTLDVASSTPSLSYGLVEVLYTLDGVEWKSLGFVEKDEFSSKHFEIPIEEASQWEDISKIQIGIQSVPVLDGVAPIIHLDSVWIEVEYQKYGEEQYPIPDLARGDVFLSEIRDGSKTAVLVARQSDTGTTTELWLHDDISLDKTTEAVIINESIKEGIVITDISTPEEILTTASISSDTFLISEEEPLGNEAKEVLEILPPKYSSSGWTIIANKDTLSQNSSIIGFENNIILWLSPDSVALVGLDILSQENFSQTIELNGQTFIEHNSKKYLFVVSDQEITLTPEIINEAE